MEATSDNGKKISIISYLFIIGWIIALIMHSSNRTALGAFHIRQMLGIMLLGVLISILLSYIGIPFLGWILQLGVIVLWILGIISAVQGELKPVPLLGEQFQEWFKGIK